MYSLVGQVHPTYLYFSYVHPAGAHPCYIHLTYAHRFYVHPSSVILVHPASVYLSYLHYMYVHASYVHRHVCTSHAFLHLYILIMYIISVCTSWTGNLHLYIPVYPACLYLSYVHPTCVHLSTSCICTS